MPRPIGKRYGPGDQQHIIMCGGPITGIDVLKVHAEKVPAQALVVCRCHHFLEADRPEQWIVSVLDIDSDASDRIEALEVHDVLAGLAFDPRKRWLACDPL